MKLGKHAATILAAALALAVGTATAAQEKVLNVYNWSDYTAPDTIPGFERTTGIKVHYDVYDSNDVLQAKLLTGHTGYDVVVPSTHYAARQIQAGLFQKLDKAHMPNLKYEDPAIMALVATVDPGNQYVVPWGMGTDGLGYNITKVRQRLGDKADLSNWDMLFKPENAAKLKDCGISVLDEASQVFPAVLHYLGKDPNSTNPEDYKAAMEVLKKIRPYIREFNSSGYIDEMASGDLCMVYGYSGDVMIARHRATEAKKPYDINYFIPKGGAPAWFDVMAVPKDAPHPENAMAFVNYIETPQVHAAITNTMFYPNANKEARKYVVKEVADNPEIYPSPEVAKTLFVIKALPFSILRLQTRLWAELKSGR